MHHSQFRQSTAFGKSPDRAVKRAMHTARHERMKGTHHSEADEPRFSSKLGPKQAKVWQALTHAAVKRGRAARTDPFGVPLDDIDE